MPPLALALLAAFVIGIPLAFLGPGLPRHWEGPPEPLYSVVDVPPGASTSDGPTVGMIQSISGYGTVATAPALAGVSSDLPPPPPTDTLPAPDVAGFIAAWARLERNPAAPDRVFTCNLMETAPGRGRVTLREGCLKVTFGDGPERPLLPLNARLFRDPQGYLALGSPDRPDEYSVRVGEPDASILVASCPVPDTVAPPPAYAKRCGSEPMVVAAQVGRRPVCSARFLAERARMEREEAATATRIKAEADACKASGRNSCAPDVIPRMPPITDGNAPCRLPAGYRSSQRSSTQP